MNALNRNSARILIAISAMFSLPAFAQHALVNHLGCSPTLIAASGIPVGQVPPCDAIASVHVTLGHDSGDAANAKATPPQSPLLDSTPFIPATVGTDGTSTIAHEFANTRPSPRTHQFANHMQLITEQAATNCHQLPPESVQHQIVKRANTHHTRHKSHAMLIQYTSVRHRALMQPARATDASVAASCASTKNSSHASERRSGLTGQHTQYLKVGVVNTVGELA